MSNNSPFSTIISDNSINSNNNSNNVDSPQPSSSLPSTTQKHKRSLAKRSCLNCREKKTRCELPDLFVPSSKQPVIESKRCHRCKVLSIDCVVWDGDRKRKLKLQPREEETASDHPNNKRTRSQWGPLSHLADVAKVVSEFSVRPTVTSSQLLTPDVFNSSSGSSHLEGQTQSHASRHSSTTSGPTSEGEGRHDIHGHGTNARPKEPPVIGLHSHEVQAMLPADCLHLDAERTLTFTYQLASHRAFRSVWRTLSILVDYAARHPQYTRYLLCRVESPPRSIGAVDVIDMINRQECLELSSCMLPYLAWHPHLPLLESVYDLYVRQPSKPTTFLLASMCLVASRHRHSSSSTLVRGLSAMVDRLGTQMILSSMRDIWIVQAFELLIAHEPGLVGTYASGDEGEQAYRASGLASEALLTNAISISRELELEKSIYKLHKHLTCRDDSLQEHQISDLLNTSSLWLNLRVWEGHYVFFRPKNRVLLDLDDLARAATCMIAVNEHGNKLEITSSNSNGVAPGSGSDSDPDSVHRNKAEKLRSAGRTILAHRIRAMAITHGALFKITDILASAREKNNSTSPNMSSNAKEHTSTSLQVKSDIVSAVRSVLREQPMIERSMQVDMAHFTMIESARLAEEWVLMELNAIFAMLCTIGSCSLFTGQVDASFASRSFIDGLRDDKDFRKGVSELGRGRLELSERLVSSFAFFNRRQINSATVTDARKNIDGVVELTGAPYFLTCAFVVDSCRLFLEGTAFVLVANHDIQQNFDARVMSMIQAAQRLEEIDSNRYCQADDCGTDEQERSIKPPLSICQLGSKLIRDMVSTMQKWRLDFSIHRMHREPDPKKVWKENTASGLLPDQTCDNENQNTLGCATHHTGTLPSSGVNVSPPRTRSTTQFATANSEYPITAGPLGTYETNAPSSGDYSLPFFTDYLYAAYPQPGFIYPTQLWQSEAGNARNFGSMEYLLSGAFPVGAASDVGGMFDASFLDTYPNPFFQQ